MNIIKTILAWLLCLVLTLSLFTFFLNLNISNFFKVEQMEKTVEKIDVSHEMDKIRNSSATSGNKAEVADIINSAYDEAEKHGISSKLVDEIFNSNEVKLFLGKAVGTTTDNLLNGSEKQPVTSKEFNQILDDNIDKWIKDSGVEISDSKKEVLVIRMKSASAGVIDNLPNSNVILKADNTNTISNVQFIFSNKVKISLLIISIVSLLLLIAIKLKKGVWLLYGGVSILISSLATIGVSLIAGDIITFALKEYNLSFMISAFSDRFSQNILSTGFMGVIISIIIFIIYNVYRKKVNQ